MNYLKHLLIFIIVLSSKNLLSQRHILLDYEYSLPWNKNGYKQELSISNNSNYGELFLASGQYEYYCSGVDNNNNLFIVRNYHGEKQNLIFTLNKNKLGKIILNVNGANVLIKISIVDSQIKIDSFKVFISNQDTIIKCRKKIE